MDVYVLEFIEASSEVFDSWVYSVHRTLEDAQNEAGRADNAFVGVSWTQVVTLNGERRWESVADKHGHFFAVTETRLKG